MEEEEKLLRQHLAEMKKAQETVQQVRDACDQERELITKHKREWLKA